MREAVPSRLAMAGDVKTVAARDLYRTSHREPSLPRRRHFRRLARAPTRVD
jgi:hypothetical protein